MTRLIQIDNRFNKECGQAVVDHFNNINATHFTYSETSVENVRAIIGAIEGQRNTSADLVLRNAAGVERKRWRITYDRLDLAVKIPAKYRYVLDIGFDIVGFMTSFEGRTGIRLDQHHFNFEEITNSTGGRSVVVTPTPTNPLWFNSIEMELLGNAEVTARDIELGFIPGTPIPPAPPPPTQKQQGDYEEDTLGGEVSFQFPNPIHTWVIRHGLTTRPSIVCVNLEGETIYGEVSYQDDGVAQVDWYNAQAGEVILR